jgi:UDP-N-acetylmuramoyl-L-alanyl-D-glutamate--2,6-diaminopimelate ligase
MRGHGVRHCVLEVSSHALHQERVAGVSFAVGMFTNLTGDHLDYHGTMDAYAAAKALLFRGLGRAATAVINADDVWADRMIGDSPANVVRFGLRGACDWTATIRRMTSDGTQLMLRGPAGIEVDYPSPLVGRHNVYNTRCATAAAYAIGVPLAAIIDGLGAMPGVPGRLERVTAPGDRFQVFVDYAHTHDALENVLLALRGTMERSGRLLCVFGCGGDRDRTKRPKMGAVAEKLADRVSVTSDNPRTEDPGRIIDEIMVGVSAGGRGSVEIEADRRAAIRQAISVAEAGDVVLIAGKGHEDYQIIGTEKRHFDDREEAVAALEGGRV